MWCFRCWWCRRAHWTTPNVSTSIAGATCAPCAHKLVPPGVVSTARPGTRALHGSLKATRGAAPARRWPRPAAGHHFGRVETSWTSRRHVSPARPCPLSRTSPGRPHQHAPPATAGNGAPSATTRCARCSTWWSLPGEARVACRLAGAGLAGAADDGRAAHRQPDVVSRATPRCRPCVLPRRPSAGTARRRRPACPGAVRVGLACGRPAW